MYIACRFRIRDQLENHCDSGDNSRTYDREEVVPVTIGDFYADILDLVESPPNTDTEKSDPEKD